MGATVVRWNLKIWLKLMNVGGGGGRQCLIEYFRVVFSLSHRFWVKRKQTDYIVLINPVDHELPSAEWFLFKIIYRHIQYPHDLYNSTQWLSLSTFHLLQYVSGFLFVFSRLFISPPPFRTELSQWRGQNSSIMAGERENNKNHVFGH